MNKITFFCLFKNGWKTPFLDFFDSFLKFCKANKKCDYSANFQKFCKKKISWWGLILWISVKIIRLKAFWTSLLEKEKSLAIHWESKFSILFCKNICKGILDLYEIVCGGQLLFCEQSLQISWRSVRKCAHTSHKRTRIFMKFGTYAHKIVIDHHIKFHKVVTTLRPRIFLFWVRQNLGKSLCAWLSPRAQHNDFGLYFCARG